MQIKKFMLFFVSSVLLQLDSAQTINDSKKSMAIKIAGAITFLAFDEIKELIKNTPSILVDKKTGAFVGRSETLEFKEFDLFFKLFVAYSGYRFAQRFTPEYKLKQAIKIINSIPSWEFYALEKANESLDAFLDAINEKYISRNPIIWAIKRLKIHIKKFETAYSILKELELNESIVISDAVEETLCKYNQVYDLLNKALLLLEKQNQIGDKYEIYK